MSRARTKQVCTIGPASVDLIPQLVAAGMDVARINFSHGTPDDHRAYVHAVRAAAHSARRSVAVMADLPGPKVRLGQIEGDGARLETGASFELRAQDGPGDAVGASVSHPEALGRLEVDDRVLLADGAAELRVVSVASDTVTTEVVNGGMVRTRSGVNVPSERLPGGGLTDEDRAAVPRALELRVDLIAQSFVRSVDDVRALRALLPTDGPRLVVKVETRAAVDNIDSIAPEVDGIMVARGDLGVDLPFEDVPLVQKDLIRRAHDADRFTIVATQMLESMTAAPRPTRAEVSDVANAVLDGADAVMLSAETAIGTYPVEALAAMERICAAVEREAATKPMAPAGPVEVDAAEALARDAWIVAESATAQAIWCFTRSGRTAELIAMARPHVPVVAFTLSPIVARRLAVRRGVTPIVMSSQAKSGTLIERMEQAWRGQRGGEEYRTVLLVTTSQNPTGINRLEIHRLHGQVAMSTGRERPVGRERARPEVREARPRPEPEPVAPSAEQPAVPADEAIAEAPPGTPAEPSEPIEPAAVEVESGAVGAEPSPPAEPAEVEAGQPTSQSEEAAPG